MNMTAEPGRASALGAEPYETLMSWGISVCVSIYHLLSPRYSILIVYDAYLHHSGHDTYIRIRIREEAMYPKLGAWWAPDLQMLPYLTVCPVTTATNASKNDDLCSTAFSTYLTYQQVKI